MEQLQDGAFEGRRPDVVENRGCKPADKPQQNKIEPRSGDVVSAPITSPLRGSETAPDFRLVLPLRRGSATPAPYHDNLWRQPLHLGEVAIFIAPGARHPGAGLAAPAAAKT